MGCMGSKECNQQQDQPNNNPQRPIPIPELGADALAAQLFSTPRNPNRQRARQQDLGTYRTPLHHSSALPNASPESQISQSFETGQFRPNISPETRATLSMLSRYHIYPGPGLGGIPHPRPRPHSTDTLPLYEPRPGSNPAEDDRQAAADASGSGPGEPGGAVRRAGTGWSAVSQYSGPPPSYRTVESRQTTWRSGRG
ncbi:hypothetical protein VM1G_07748 [Cytospora mali]|uniref:Uncharacterized protein n=1 Tax=Cytospora mali TaxID=578113 RepID=A0A194W881_CYTMA|nr:hypothetical protein VM1G_07748 [Valsa mali]